MGTKFNYQRKLGLIPPAGPLKFVAICILGPLPRTNADNQFVIIRTNRYTNVGRVIQRTQITLRKISSIVFNNWINLYGIPYTVLCDHCQRFFGKFFTSLCFYPLSAELTLSTFHLQRNCKMERYYRIVYFRLGMCIAGDQKDWYIFVQPLAYASNCQVHRFTTKTHFTLRNARHLPGLATTDSLTPLPRYG